MNEKIKKTFRAITSAALAGAFVVSSAIGGGIGLFADPSVSFAAEADVDDEGADLEAGKYTLPIIRQWNEQNSGFYKGSPLHFCAQGILNVDDNGSQFLTIGVENWSLYDAFIPRKQGYFNDEYRYLPSSLFDQDNSNNFTNFIFSEYETVIDSNNSMYKISTEDSKTKFGAISVDYETSKNNDVAYVTFELDDYKSAFSISAWLNTQYKGYNTTVENANKRTKPNKIYQWANISLCLDTTRLTDVSSMYEGKDDINVTYSMILASGRGVAVKPTTPNTTTSGVNNWMVNYSSDKSALQVFDYGEISFENEKYIGRYHINPDGYDYGGTTNDEYINFYTISSVKHPIEVNDNTTYDDWDILLTGTTTSLDLDEDGYINVEYNSLEEALIGKYIFFQVWRPINDNKQNSYVVCCLRPSAEEFTITDEESGIYVKTDVSTYPKTAKLKIEKNGDVYKKENNGELTLASAEWNRPLYKKPNWYTISITDENGNTLEDKNVDLYVPVPEDKPFVSFVYNNEVIVTSGDYSKSAIKFNIENNELHYPDIVVNGLTVAVMQYNDISDVHGITEDGLYTANAFFIHKDRPYNLSMADSGLVKRVYINVKNGEKKMYFLAGPVLTDAYIGDLHCNNVKVAGEIYEDSISYTNLEVENGEIVGNQGYNGYTEFANIKGGVLTLMDECYIQDGNYYNLAIVSPVMLGLGGELTPYDSIVKDGLVTWLQFTDLKKCDDSVTLDKVLNEYGYGYQPSALLRKIRQAELKLERKNSYSSTSVTKLQSVYDAITKSYGSSYDSLSAANLSSNDIENMITDLDNAIANLKEPEVTVSGYQASVADNVTLNYVLNIPEALEDKADGGKLMATITYADGTTKEIAVQAEDEYFVPVSVAPKEIANEISVTIGDGTFTYSVKEYLESVVSSETATDSKKAVAKSLLNYAGCAQDYFKAKNADANAYLSDTKANENVDSTLADITDDAVKAFDAPTLVDNVSFYGASLTCDYDTSIKMYFKVTDDIANHTFTANGKTVEAVEAADGIYCITYSGISAKNLTKAYTFSVDGKSFTYGAYNYIYAALNATEVQSGALTELQNMVKAIYYYAEAAKLA